MGDKKRTTAITIETHEVWIIRKAVPEHPDEAVMPMPDEIEQPPGVSSLSELKNSPETEEEEP